MSDLAVRVDNLGKRFDIGRLVTTRQTLKLIGQALAAPVRILKGENGQLPMDEDQSFWALRNVSFDLKRGEVLGVIGRNGAGKSTLLKILSRITAPTEGCAEMYGRIGSLLEVGTGFHPELTGRENAYLNGAILGMRKAEIDRKFDEIVAFAEVEKFIDTPVKRYSSGMRTRLAFAVAANLEPEILIVDEVLAVGDAAFQKKCLGKMDEVAHQGRTILFVSHNMASVQALCSRAVLIHGGRLVLDGTPEQAVAEYLKNNAGKGSATFDSTTPRSGNGAAQYLSARVLNQDNQPTSSIPMGQALTIELEFKVNRDPLTRSSFGVIFRSAMGQPIMRSNTADTVGSVPEARQGGVIRLRVDRLDFLPGSYYLTLGMSNARETVDRIEDAVELDVTPMPVYPTGKLPPPQSSYLVFAPCSWSWEYR